MARFYGIVGYVSFSETSPGVHTEQLIERYYRGDVITNTRVIETREGINDNVRIDQTISIVADALLYLNCTNIRYVIVEGVKWKITSVKIARPRLLLNLGDIYHG